MRNRGMLGSLRHTKTGVVGQIILQEDGCIEASTYLSMLWVSWDVQVKVNIMPNAVLKV